MSYLKPLLWKKIILVGIWILFPLSGMALESADEIQNNIGQTSSVLLDQILEINDGVGEIRTYQSFKRYFALLPFLEQKAQELDLDSIYPGVVAKLADTLAAHGMRWVKVTESTPAEILQIFRVMKADTMNAFLYKLQTEMEAVENNFDEQDVAEKFQQMSSWIDQNFPENREINDKIDYLTSSLSEKVLTRGSDLDEESLVFWTSGLKKTQFVEGYLVYLHSKILESNDDEIPYLTLATLKLGTHIQTLENLPSGITNNYANLFIELLGKALETGVKISKEDIILIMSDLNAVSLQGMVYRLINVQSLPNSDGIDEYLKTLDVIIDELLKRGLSGPAQELGRHVGARMAAAIANAKGHEGTYRLRDGDGNIWILTLLQSTEDRLIATLGFNNGTIYQSFFNIIYSVDKDKYLLSEFIPDNGNYPNFISEIEIDTGGNMTVILPFAPRESRKQLTGTKIERYENFFNIQNLNANYISGEYRGQIQLPGGKKKNVTLLVQNFPEYSIGRLVMERGAFHIELQHGTQGGLGFIYLTSGKTRAGSMFHLRLKQDSDNEDQLTGFLVIGGKGMGSIINLEKVN